MELPKKSLEQERKEDCGKSWDHLYSRALEEKAASAIEVGNVRKGVFFFFFP